MENWDAQFRARTAAVMAGLADVGRAATNALITMRDVLNAPEWQRWILKEQRRERYLRRYARGPR